LFFSRNYLTTLNRCKGRITDKIMLVKVLKAISRSTGFLAKTIDKSQKKTDDILKKEYLHNFSQFVMEKSGVVVEKVGYAAGKIEEILDDVKPKK